MPAPRRPAAGRCCLALLGLLCLAACSGRSVPATDGGDDGPPGSDPIWVEDRPPGRDRAEDPCWGLDENQCAETEGCRRVVCPGCNGRPGPFQCVGIGGNAVCPDSACVECGQLSGEAACLTIPGCAPRICPACPGSSRELFIDCVREDRLEPPVCICPPDCDGLADTASCEAEGCTALSCAGCNGQSSFEACYDPASSSPPVCPDIDCVDCVGLDEPGCWAEPACRADYCTGCTGNDSYTGCSPQGGKPTMCPALGCAMPVCDGLDEAGCGAAPLCHVVHDFDGGYSHCASGTADCESPTYCTVPIASCPDGFRYLVRDGCFEGCALVPDQCEAP